SAPEPQLFMRGTTSAGEFGDWVELLTTANAGQLDDLPFSPDGLAGNQPWNDLGKVAIRRPLTSLYDASINSVFPDHEAIHDYLDDLTSEFDEYITKTVLGQDEWGNDICQYAARPADYINHSGLSYDHEAMRRPKVVIVGSTHGNEKHAAVANVIFFENLCRKWKEIEGLDELRWGAEVILIPVMNPTGY